MKILHGDCRDILPTLPENYFHAVVTDPPYFLSSIQDRFGQTKACARQRQYARLAAGFMGNSWDSRIAFDPATWIDIRRVMRPGAHIVAFGGVRTHHRMMVAMEDAGLEIRDCLMFLFGTGFPKSRDIGRSIDKHFGAERDVIGHRDPNGSVYGNVAPDASGSHIYSGNLTSNKAATPEAAQWNGWGSALKPAYEPIIVARKPLDGTLAENTMGWGVGGFNIDACRIPVNDAEAARFVRNWDREMTTDIRSGRMFAGGGVPHGIECSQPAPDARWPANILLDGSDEVEAMFAEYGPSKSRKAKADRVIQRDDNNVFRHGLGSMSAANTYADEGSVSRFFYGNKAGKQDRAGSKHPTVKSQELMTWLIKLVTPRGGTILDPFAGSGSTGQAGEMLGHDVTMIEQEAAYVADIERRMTQLTKNS